MPPRLKRRRPGELPPAPKRPTPEPSPSVSRPETLGDDEVVIIDDDEPDLTIDVDGIVARQAEERPREAGKLADNPFLPQIHILERIRL